MRLGARIVSLLTADTVVTGLVGTQIYPHLMPEGINPPAIVYTVYVNSSLTTLDGSDETRTVAFQLSCFAQRYEIAQQVADAVEAVFSARQGPGLDMSDGPIAINIRRRDMPPEFQPQWFHVVVDVTAMGIDQ